jgi:hypothetical protein
MPTTFQIADTDVTESLGNVIAEWHRDLAETGVRIGVIFATNPDGPAVTHGGYPAFAKIKVVSLKDRVSKGYDAELLIDEGEWNSLSPAQRVALLDHEVTHLTLVPLSEKELKAARGEDPSCPDWKLDDLGRPKLKTRPGDIVMSDGFTSVVGRHGENSIEYVNISRAKIAADAAKTGGQS